MPASLSSLSIFCICYQWQHYFQHCSSDQQQIDYFTNYTFVEVFLSFELFYDYYIFCSLGRSKGIHYIWILSLALDLTKCDFSMKKALIAICRIILIRQMECQFVCLVRIIMWLSCMCHVKILTIEVQASRFNLRMAITGITYYKVRQRKWNSKVSIKYPRRNE